MAPPLLRVVLALALVLGACDSPTVTTVKELHAEAKVITLPPATYYGVAWVEANVLALAALDATDESLIEIASRDGDVLRTFKPRRSEECARYTFRGLHRSPNGQVGGAEICTLAFADPPAIAALITLDPQTLEYRSLGATRGIPSWLAWRSDMKSAVYSVADDLCAVLYERALSDGPLDLTVTSQGVSFPVGGDSAGECPTEGRASYPAFNQDDRLAFMASANEGRSGQDVLELPWTLFATDPNGQPSRVIDGIREPRGLGWLTVDRLIFSGALQGSGGIWSVRADGSDLVRIADDSASWLAAAPDSESIAAIRELAGAAVLKTEVVIYDLSAAGL